MLGVYTRWFNDWALLIGWAIGMFVGTFMAASVNFSATYPLAIGGFTVPGYAALYAVVLNLVVAAVLTPALRAFSSPVADVTAEADYVSSRA